MVKWKTVKDHKDYEVSNTGEVRSIHSNKLIIGDKNSVGYRRVTLYYGNKRRYFVHRLVALHFCEGYSEELVVNHKDGNKLNNNSSNLEWVTRSENDKHAFANKLRTVHNHTSVSKVDPVTDEIIQTYSTVKEARMDNPRAGYNISTIVASGNQKTAGGFKWKYA